MSDIYIFFFEFTICITALIVLLYFIQLLNESIFQKHKKITIEADLTAVMKGDTEHLQCRYRNKNDCILLFNAFISILQNIEPGKAEQRNVINFLAGKKMTSYFVKQIRSTSVYRRSRAAHYLGYLGEKASREALRKQLFREKKENVKLYLIYAVCLLNDTESIPGILFAMQNTSDLFVKRTAGLFTAFPSFCITLFYKSQDKKDITLIKLITEVARISPYRIFPQFLVDVFLDSSCPLETRRTAFGCLMNSYPESLDPAGFIDYFDDEFEQIAIAALGRRPDTHNAEFLIQKAMGTRNAEYAVAALSSMVEQSDTVFFYVINLFKKETLPKRIDILAGILSSRFEYFLPGISEAESRNNIIISELIKSGKTSGLISFMNENTDREIENRLVSIIQNTLQKEKTDTSDFQIYLKETILQKVGLERKPPLANDGFKRREYIKRIPLSIILSAILVLPVLFFLSIYFSKQSLTLRSKEGIFVNDILFAFGCYALALDVFYSVLSFLSFRESLNERNYFLLKPSSFLFLPDMLPSVSILSPAFCEQETIIESVESLLNVNYPDYEIIVINDGSTDKTLDILLSHFNLKKTDVVYTERLQTRKVRGIYKNELIPHLTVIDKINGGKADSLNAGVNFASKEYVLGTDSDCILDRDSLLHMMAPFIDEKKMVIASGGVIVPANGCTVKNGAIEERHVPKELIPRLQTLEYFRAFLSNRLGWSKLRTMMIISGAFGVFRREQILSVHGYLTGKEKYAKDTVGEDMELLIRVVGNLKDNSEPYSVLYSSGAVCWTEVPSSLKILKRQRDRWQRGLIDILFFHNKMFFNPRYGSHGMFGFPYYFIVEVIGPWFQMLSMILLAAGLCMGLVSTDMLLFILSADLIITLALSIFALYIGNTGKEIFSVKDQLKLIIAAIPETLGLRLIISFFRITGYISALRNVTGWNKFSRKGFLRKGGNT